MLATAANCAHRNVRHGACNFLNMDIPRPESKRKRWVRRATIAGGLTLLLVILSAMFSRFELKAKSVERTSVWVDQVRTGEMVIQVSGPGALVPREVRWIAAQTDARVERVALRPGTLVEPNTVLVEMSNPDLKQQTSAALFDLKNAQAGLIEAESRLLDQQLELQASLAAARAEFESARLQAEAEQSLAAQGIVSTLQSKRSSLMEEQLRIRMETVAARLEQSKASMQSQLAVQRTNVERARNIYDRRLEQMDSLNVR